MAETFPGVIAFAFMVSLILAGVLLRARFAFIQRALVPVLLTCVAIAVSTGLLCFGAARYLKSFSVERAVTVFGFHVMTIMAPVLLSFSLITIGVVYTGTFIVGAALLTLLSRKSLV